MHWPTPVVAEDLEERAGPVMVTVEYRIAAKDRDSFLVALERVAAERRRDGAYAWSVFEDATDGLRSDQSSLKRDRRLLPANPYVRSNVRFMVNFIAPPTDGLWPNCCDTFRVFLGPRSLGLISSPRVDEGQFRVS